MKTLTLQTLRIKNFKGVSAYTLEPFGQNLTVCGKNESGKSSIVDGFNWLLFGKDSQGRADFQLKPVDSRGQEKHNLDTEVEATMEIDGKPITIMRRFKEKYAKKRGEALSEFTGHTTDYFIDEVPAKKKEFDEKIAEIIDANSFKLVTNPYEFNLLHWTDRRQLLMEMCGDVTDKDIIKSDDTLNTLAEILGDCTAEGHKKKIKAKKQEINRELDQIPIRIDELSTSAQTAPAPAPKKIQNREKQIEEQQEKLQGLKSNERMAAKQARLSEVNAEISQATGKAQDQANEKKGPINAEIDRLTAELRDINNQIQSLQDDIARDEKRNQVTGDAMASLRDQWEKIKSNEPMIKTECPTCGQDLPEDQIESTRGKFNQDKAQRLKLNQTEGKALSETFKSRETLISDSKTKVDELSASLPGIEDQIKSKQAELKTVYVPVDVDALDREKNALESEIKALKNGSKVQENGCREKIKELQAEIAELQEQEAAYKAAKNTRVRIAELEGQEQELAAAFEALEKELFLIEKFIIRKVEMIEGQINSRFKMARFKLFEEQINGGINECCETLYNGVPYNSGLNSAARINVGLDIIATLSEFYGLRAPIFIDNSESVNSIIPMDAQVIALAVSEDKELTVVETEVREAS